MAVRANGIACSPSKPQQHRPKGVVEVPNDGQVSFNSNRIVRNNKTTTRSSPALYITVHPQQPPFFSVSSSTPILAMPFWDWPPVGAPVYEDISLLYLRISRTMS